MHKRGPTLLIAIMVVIGNGLCPTFLNYCQVCFNTWIGMLLAYDALNKGSRSSYAVNEYYSAFDWFAPILQVTVWFLKVEGLAFEKHFSRMSSASSLFIKSSRSLQNHFCKTQFFQLCIAFGWIQGHFKYP